MILGIPPLLFFIILACVLTAGIMSAIGLPPLAYGGRFVGFSLLSTVLLISLYTGVFGSPITVAGLVMFVILVIVRRSSSREAPPTEVHGYMSSS